MRIKIGETIKQLRQRNRCTQKKLANAIGVTSQAVSRWESGDSYPEMETIPYIADYFGVTIDELFDSENDYRNKVDVILKKVEYLRLEHRDDDKWVEESLTLLREGLAEFPKNEYLLFALADTLFKAGRYCQNDWGDYTDNNHMQYSYIPQKRNMYWRESAKICENLMENASDHFCIWRAISLLVFLYRNMGESEKAIAFANRMPTMANCRENLLVNATAGTNVNMYIGDLLLKLTDQMAEYLVYSLNANQQLYTRHQSMQKIKGILLFFDLLCDDGNMGPYHYTVNKLYLYLARLQFEQGSKDEAHISINAALMHAQKYEKLCDGKEHTFTASLLSSVKFCIDHPKNVRL